MSRNWTAEEYREFLRTGKEPEAERQRKIEEAWARAEREGRVMVLDIGPVPAPEKEKREPEKRSKYGNRKTEVDGKKFDSQHEARVYEELMIRVRAGELKAVCRQVGFDLPGGIRYFADFVTIAPDNTIEVLDAKSEATRKNRVYINKKKQMKALWGIEIREV